MIPESIVNHIANITIVDSYLNKSEIKDKAPAKYMDVYRQENPLLPSTMETHLIGDLEDFGVWSNNYSVFFKKRILTIAQALAAEMVLTEQDIADKL